jgi:hypothetical protein
VKLSDVVGQPSTGLKLSQVMEQPQQEQPGVLEQIGRQLGLTGRYALEGAGGLAGMVTDGVGQFLPGYEPTGQAASRLADTLGLPKPQGDLEQGVANASRALVGTGLTAGAGLAVGAPQLAAQPMMQAASTLAGSGAQTAAQQAGAGEGAQALAALAGGVGVGAAAGAPMAVRGAFRGGEQGRQALLDNLEAFAAAGTTPTVGQGTQGRVARAAESLLSRVPGGAGVMAKKAQGEASDIGGALQRTADDLAPKTNPTTAGRAIERGITGSGGFVDRFKAKTRELYDAVDQYMPGDTAVPLKATQSFLAKVSAPTKGAEQTSAALANPKLGAIGEALGADLAANNGALPYEAAKALRTRVGEMIANAGIVSDVPRGELKQLYGALSQDIRNQAAKDPKAYAAANRAENYYRAGMDRLDKVESVVDRAGGTEKIFQAATAGTREGATTLRSVMQSLKPDEARVVSSAVVRRLGRANPGAQNDVGDAFSTETFLTNWNGMSKEAKAALFDRMGPKVRSDMDHIARVASNLRDGSKVFRNPSGTSDATAQIAAAGSALTALLTGNTAALGALGATVGGSNLMARGMTSPTFVRWLAQQSNKPAGALRGQVGVLATMADRDGDEDAAEIAAMLSQQ